MRHLSCLTMTICLMVSTCSAQTSAVSAKQHYQNAQNAIKAGDYDVAANELRTAARFAPRNALIWYDLGVVLDKEHKDTEARQAMEKALRLGLPATEKEKANALLKTLSRSSDVPTSSSSEQREASLKTTTDFLKSKIEGSSATGNVEGQMNSCLANGRRTDTWNSFEVDGCIVQAQETETTVGTLLAGTCSVRNPSPDVYKLTFSFSHIALASSKVEQEDASDVLPSGHWVTPIYQVHLYFDEALSYYVNDESRTAKDFRFEVQDREMGDRLLRAFVHAAELCGAKKEAF